MNKKFAPLCWHLNYLAWQSVETVVLLSHIDGNRVDNNIMVAICLGWCYPLLDIYHPK